MLSQRRGNCLSGPMRQNQQKIYVEFAECILINPGPSHIELLELYYLPCSN
jgi:hypothetical protein